MQVSIKTVVFGHYLEDSDHPIPGIIQEFGDRVIPGLLSCSFLQFSDVYKYLTNNLRDTAIGRDSLHDDSFALFEEIPKVEFALFHRCRNKSLITVCDRQHRS
ncbi:hypothetical protein TNIN_164661 [Trichonephila inaurata madagascariensis]|uniref:Uncharacterized protein n=1 Tax=Trichonephila inaurata madagascariensis TaxID=2747483 RepID=A0A8X7C264_9ARAC|nr:hypothetical protein TNIN_164661 [Trichonephila inaurata madagascariensis]